MIADVLPPTTTKKILGLNRKYVSQHFILIFRSASSSTDPDGKKKNNQKVSNSNNWLSPASTRTMIVLDSPR